MKKALSVIVLFAFAAMPLVPVSAQKNRSSRLKEASLATPAASATFFDSVGAVADRSGVLVRWSMKAEVGNLGFYVYRLDSRSERMVSPDAVLGAGTRFKTASVPGESYEFFDRGGDAGGVYIVEAVGLDGKRLRSNGVVPSPVDSVQRFAADPTTTVKGKIEASTGSITATVLSLSKELINERESNAIAPDPVTHRAVISRPGVKIGVKGEGLFKVTRAELQAGGFDVNGDSNLWQLYVNGVEQALNIGPNGDFIEFYGKGVDTVESDIQTYYLITGDNPGKRIEARTTRLGTSTVQARNFPETIIKKERTNYLSQVFNGQLGNYFGRVITATQTGFPFNVTGVDFSSPTATFTVAVQGYSFDTHQLEMSLNGHALDPLVSAGRQPYSTTITIPTAWLNEGGNDLQLRAAGPTGDVSFFDHVQLSYDRKYVAEQNRIKFFTPNYKTTVVDGFTSANIRVYDITDENKPVLAVNLPIVQNGPTYSVTLPAGRGRLFYAVEDSAVATVQSVAANDPALLSSPTNGANLVIISHKSLLPQADAWADYRRSQGITVKVVEVSEIYDEFNYGVLSADSIKAFLTDAETVWQTAPGYALLIGDASYDSRNYQGTGYFNMVPTKFVTTVFVETGSDEAMADFNDDGLSEIAIGRIPVRTGQLVTDILNRQIAWEAAVVSPLNRGALFAFDLPTTYDFEAMSGRIRDQLPAGTPTMSIGRSSPTAQADLVAAMNTGKYLVNYAGHGTTGAWAATNFFANTTVPQLSMTPQNRSLYTMLTCLNGYFMNVTADSLAENLLKASNGGAVAAWASAGETTPDIQEVMALRFYNQIGSGPVTLNRLGDLIRDAKTTIPGGSDVRLSWALVGDPMLKVK